MGDGVAAGFASVREDLNHPERKRDLRNFTNNVGRFESTRVHRLRPISRGAR